MFAAGTLTKTNMAPQMICPGDDNLSKGGEICRYAEFTPQEKNPPHHAAYQNISATRLSSYVLELWIVPKAWENSAFHCFTEDWIQVKDAVRKAEEEEQYSSTTRSFLFSSCWWSNILLGNTLACITRSWQLETQQQLFFCFHAVVWAWSRNTRLLGNRWQKAMLPRVSFVNFVLVVTRQTDELKLLIAGKFPQKITFVFRRFAFLGPKLGVGSSSAGFNTNHDREL